MKRKILLFNVMFLVYLTNATVSDGQSSEARLPDGAIARFNPGASVYTVAFSPDGQLLASGGADNAVILWDVPRQAEIRTLIGHGDWVKSVAFSPDGQLLASVAMGRLPETVGGSLLVSTSLRVNRMTGWRQLRFHYMEICWLPADTLMVSLIYGLCRKSISDMPIVSAGT